MLKYTLLSIFIFLSQAGFGRDIIGKIVDNSGNPIIEAYILNGDGSFHASSNELGIFTCKNAQIGDTLIISYLGFEPKEIIVSEDNFLEIMTIVLEDKFFDLDQIQISNSMHAVSQLSALDLKNNPVKSSQEILRKIPGLFIAQHAGGGKAEQLFLRGFDIDHGTDIAISVDGMPVNLVSHAHGQGYADLHFLIPETVERLDFGKGPYYVNKGNFTTAGYVDFQTKDQLDKSSVSLEIGQYNTKRAVALVDLLANSKNQKAYIAGEFLSSDGPFISPQDFHRINGMAKYTLKLPNNNKLSVLGSWFDSKWNASGQIPQRAVDSGLIDRFGAIDDTEGGYTGRTNIIVNYTKNIDNQSFIKNNLFYSHNHFELFSNFTFFANDPLNGDQIRQKESRNLFGFESVFHKNTQIIFGDFNYKLGAGLRKDLVNEVGLSHTLNRNTLLNSIAQGTVDETNYYSFFNGELNLGDFILNPGFRFDFLNFIYSDDLSSRSEKNKATDLFVSPKLNILYNPSQQLQLFFKSGLGFHSNDTRVVVAQNGKQTLPGAFGMDVGGNFKPNSRLWLNTAIWFLHLQQEFVYVGDEGIVEPSGKTRRLGIDLGMRWQLASAFYFNTDFNYTIARSIEAHSGENRIPLAPELTMTGGLDMQLKNGLSGGIHYRFIKNRPATEDNSIIAKGYFITDLNLNYAVRKINFGLILENIFNQDWNEAQFATSSRLQQEPEVIEELHFTPGMPFFFKGKVTYLF